MSDQDFFFDEEDEKPARTAKTSGGKASGAKTAAKPAVKEAPAKAETVAAGGSFFDRQLNMGIASLIVVCALLLGLAGGIALGQARADSVLATAGGTYDPTALGGTAGGQTAPQLTQEQLDAGKLPAGHPSVNGAATATGSASATSGQ